MSTALAAHTGETIGPDPVTEAMIICSALAWKGNPLSGLDIHTGYAQRIVNTTRLQHEPHEILNWRADTDPSSWTLRWAWGSRVIRQRFPYAVGLDTLPRAHEELPQV